MMSKYLNKILFKVCRIQQFKLPSVSFFAVVMIHFSYKLLKRASFHSLRFVPLDSKGNFMTQS